MSALADEVRAAVAAVVDPLAAELRQARGELAAIRRALPPRVVTVAVAAAELEISIATVRRRIADGSLPVVRVGRSVRVDLSRVVSIGADDVTAAAASTLRAVR